LGSGAETLREKHAFTVAMLQVYHDASRELTDEAEDLIARGIQMREDAIAMLARANELAADYARAVDEAGAEDPW
jgi:hypothetical protein